MASAPAYTPCRCGCQPLVLTGCGCPECGTGRGTDHTTARRTKAKARLSRMQTLLAQDPLSPEEARELDELLHLYIHQN